MPCTPKAADGAKWSDPEHMPIHYENDADHVVLITIDRPEARNSCDMEHFKLLREAWERFAADDEAWVAIVTGVGEAFFSGADLKKYVPEITKFQKEIAEKGLDRDQRLPARRRHARRCCATGRSTSR